MRPTWLIEADVYGEEVNPLLVEVRRQGMAADLVPHQALKKGLSPAVGGQRYWEARSVMAPSFEIWLGRLADSMEAGTCAWS